MARPHRKCSVWVIGAICSARMLLVPPAVSAVTPDQVDSMLDRAKVFLYRQEYNGNWERHPAKPTPAELAEDPHSALAGNWGGETALVVYALLAAGESPTDPRLVKPIQFLQTADLTGTYALGIRAQLYTLLPQTRENRLAAERDAARFEAALFKEGAAKGLFDYQLDSKRINRMDHSVSQYGVLGAWACQRSGAEISTAFWRSVQEAWIRDQAPDGSWSYGRPGASAATTGDERGGPRASMTAAGIATLFITQDYVDATNGIKCTGNVPNPHIDAGLKWIGDNFEHVITDEFVDSPFYALYGIERIGVASGHKYLGTVNWYDRGADYLMQYQALRGAWGNSVDTCFAMLFLARGRAPVLFNKLQYESGGTEGDWNERPRDIANLTRWISKKTERDLNWQIVNLKGPVGELLDAPVLYISGNKPLQFSPADESKLREYCEDGGLLVGNPDCGSSAFAESFHKLGSRLFHDCTFRNLPANHPIYTNEQYPRTGWKPAPTVLGLSNGVRELMLLINNSDPGRFWQTEEAQQNLAAFELADDMALYAIDKTNLLEKGATFAASIDNTLPTTRAIKLARLQFAGNWNPEPGGWRRLAAILHNHSRIRVDISIARLGSNQLGDGKSGATVAALTGTGPIKLNAEQRKEIHDFLQGGGTLIVDAAGGDTQFAATVEAELTAIVGPDAVSQLKTPLPPSAPIYNLPGGIIREIKYRPFAKVSVGSMSGPLLAAATVNNRTAVYYSRLDLSAGIVGQPTDGIIGYDPAVATAIMTNLVVASGLGDHAPVSPTR